MPDRRNGRPLIVPLFMPNQGCPHRCVYCRQERITGKGGRILGPAEVERVLEDAVRSPRVRAAAHSEIAFYGGTFTGLSPKVMEGLLKAAFSRVLKGPFRGIRVSTRPDALDDERLSLLGRYGVNTVELGVQSMHDDVLRRSRRGYASETVAGAVERLRRWGFEVGIQLMPGLPGDSPSRFFETVERSVALRPGMVRLYPTVVLEDTVLADWTRQGRYRPLSLEDAVTLCADACGRFEARGIPVIRIGLFSEDDLRKEGGLVAGPWHPALGFLVRSELYHRSIRGLGAAARGAQGLLVRVHPNDVPLLRGHRNQGLRALEKRAGGRAVEVVLDEDAPRGRPEIGALPVSPDPREERRARP